MSTRTGRFELQFLWRALRERTFLALVGACLLVYGLVLQRPLLFDLDVGTTPAHAQANSFDHLVGQTFAEQVGRGYDESFLAGFYAREDTGSLDFRWSSPQSAVIVPGLSGTPLQLRLRMYGAVSGAPTTARLLVDGRPLAEFEVTYPLHDYTFVVDRGRWPADVLRVDLQSSPFRPGGQDTRTLGILLDRFQALGWRGMWRPVLPWTALCLSGVVAFVYLGFRRAGLSPVVVTVAVTLGAGLLLVVLLLPSRPFVAAYAGRLLLAAGLSYPVLVLTLWASRRILDRAEHPPDVPTWRWLAVIFLLAFLARFGGALSPRYASHDGPFHANRLQFVEAGDLFFEHYSIEAGMRSDPYPGALYLTLAPWTVIVGDRGVLLAFFLAWLGAAEVLLFWFLARQVLMSQTSRWAALLYASLPIGLAAFWFGIYANLFATAVLLLVAVAVVLVWQGRLSTSLLLWVPLMALLFLAHFGTVILWVPMAVLWAGLLYFRGSAPERRRLRTLGLAWVLALLVAVGVYYSNFSGFFASMGSALFTALSADGGLTHGSGEGFSLERTMAEARVWWRWGVLADYAGLGLPVAALGGMVMVRRGGRRPVWHFAISVAAVAGGFWALSMLTAYFTRYMLFVLPAVALGCAEFLGAVWRRGPAGRILVVVLLGYVGAITAVFWLNLCFLGLRPPHVL